MREIKFRGKRLLAIIVPFLSVILIWGIAAFVRWDCDLSTMADNDRVGLIAGWLFLCVIGWVTIGMWICFKEQDQQ